MADKEASPEKKSWMKGLLGALGGVLSGALVMYFTPWVDKVIKPAKPVANFSVDHDGNTVRFHNLSLTRGDGWWEFGDGSPLVPVSTDTEFVTHTYPQPGDYTAKMTLRNPLGEENERAVTVHLGTPPVPDKPQVVSLEAVPMSAGSYAPATFKLVSKVDHAEKCVWDFGDERPMVVTADATAGRDRLVTFTQPGGYVVKLMAINGTQLDERTEIITVLESPTNTVSVVVNVTDDATRLDAKDQRVHLGITFPPECAENTFAFERPFMAPPGYTIADVRIPSLVANGPEARLGTQTVAALDCGALGIRSARNVQLHLSEDRRTVKVTGELVRQPGEGGRLSHAALALPVILTVQQRVPAHQVSPMTTTVRLPTTSAAGTTTLPMPPVPATWVANQRTLRMELRDGDRVVWQGSQLPRGVLVTVGKRRCLLTGTLVGDQLRVDLADAPAGYAATGN